MDLVILSGAHQPAHAYQQICIYVYILRFVKVKQRFLYGMNYTHVLKIVPSFYVLSSPKKLQDKHLIHHFLCHLLLLQQKASHYFSPSQQGSHCTLLDESSLSTTATAAYTAIASQASSAAYGPNAVHKRPHPSIEPPPSHILN